MIEIYAVLVAILFIGLCAFQLLLALGAPLGRYAWGGSHVVLPTKLRLSSLLSIFLYLIFIGFILSKAGIIELVSNQQILNGGMWGITGYLFLGIFMNAISRSTKERIVMTPLVCILAILFLLVALA